MNKIEIDSLIALLPKLELTITRGQGTTNPYKIEGLLKLRDGVINLDSLGYFKDLTDKLRKTLVYTSPYMGNTQDVNSEESERIFDIVNQIKTRIEGISEAYKKSADINTTTSLLLSYHTLKDFTELERFAKDLKQGLELPIKSLTANENNLEILAVEDGSIILTIGFGTAIFLITKLLDITFKYRAKIQEAKRNSIYTDSLEIDIELKKVYAAAIENQIKTYLHLQSEILVKESIPEEDNEKIEIVKNAVQTLSELIDKGMKIVPAIDAPSAVKEQFEEFKNLESGAQTLLDNKDSK